MATSCHYISGFILDGNISLSDLAVKNFELISAYLNRLNGDNILDWTNRHPMTFYPVPNLSKILGKLFIISKKLVKIGFRPQLPRNSFKWLSYKTGIVAYSHAHAKYLNPRNIFWNFLNRQDRWILFYVYLECLQILDRFPNWCFWAQPLIGCFSKSSALIG